MENKLRQFFQNFGFFKNRQNAILAFILVATLILPQHFAHAGILDWILKAIVGGVTFVIAAIVLALAQAIIGVASVFLMTVADPAFICVKWAGNECVSSRYTEISFVKEGLILSRDLAGIFLVMALISIGVGVALKLLDAKSSLTKFAASAVLIFITPLITGPIIDFSNIFMFSFLKSGAVAGLLGQMQLVDTFADIFGKTWNQDPSFSAFFLTIAAALLVLLAFALFAGYTMFRIAILLLTRYVALWLLIMLAPLAFAMQAFGQMPRAPYFAFFEKVGSYYTRWWQEFINWCFVGVNVSVFLYIAGRTSLSLLGSESKLLNVKPIGGEVFWITNVSADFSTLISTILPIIIPLIILHVGYSLSMDFATGGAKAVLGAADGIWNLGKTAIFGVGAAAGGAAWSKVLASNAGRRTMAGIQGLTSANAKDTRFGKWFKSTAIMRGINRSAANGLQRSDEIKGKRQQAAQTYVERAKKLDERMEEQGREGGYLEGLSTSTALFEVNYQEQAKLIELAKKGKIPGLKDNEKKKILANKSIDNKTRKAMVEADQFILNDPILGEEFLNVYNTKDTKDMASIAMNDAVAKTGVDLKDPKNSKLKDLFKNIFKTSNFGQSFDSEMASLGLTDIQQHDIKDARAKFYDKVKEQAIKDAINSLNKEKLDNIGYEDLMKPDLIEKIAKYSKDKEVIMGMAKRGGSEWFEKYVQAIPQDKIGRTLGAFNAEDLKSLGPNILSSQTIIDPMMSSLNDAKTFASYMSQLPDNPQINQQINQIINDPTWQKNAVKNNNTTALYWAATVGARTRQISLKDPSGAPIDFGSIDKKEADKKIRELINARI